MSKKIRNRMQVIDLIREQARENGVSLGTLSSDAGYATSYLSNAGTTGSMSIQACIDHLDVLGLQLIVVPSDAE